MGFLFKIIAILIGIFIWKSVVASFRKANKAIHEDSDDENAPVARLDLEGQWREAAKELGCENLHFINPNGLHDEDHYCSAYDLYLIAKQCQKYEAFREIVQSKSFTVPATDVYQQEDRTFENTNELLLDGSYYYRHTTRLCNG